MKTYQADEAIARFRQCYDEARLSYEITESSADFVRITVTKDNVSIDTWFDFNTQLWGFDLLQGGHKQFPKFEEFEDFFGTYLSIHTVFIPNAKIVTDAFEKEYGINTVYDNFSGNKKNGYVARFKVLGSSEQMVLVQRVPEGYLVRLTAPDEDPQKVRIRAEYKYDINENGDVVSIPTMSSYSRKLKELYANDSSKQIQRVAENIFSFSIEGLVITAEIQFNYTEVRYKVTEVGCYDADLMVAPEDPFNLSAVYLACKDFYDDCVAGDEDEGSGDSSEGLEDASSADDFGGDDFGGSSEAEAQSDGEVASDGAYTAGLGSEAAEAMRQEENDASWQSFGINDGEEESEAAAGAPDAEQEDPVAEVPAEKAPAEEPAGSEDAEVDGAEEEAMQAAEVPAEAPEVAEAPPAPPQPVEAEAIESKSREVGTDMAVQSIKLVQENGETTGVQFIADDNIYMFGVEMVKDAGVPVRRIGETVNMVVRAGMKMTEDEVRLKRYAVEMENPGEVLDGLIKAMFG